MKQHCPACNGDELAHIGGEWVSCPGLDTHEAELARLRGVEQDLAAWEQCLEKWDVEPERVRAKIGALEAENAALQRKTESLEYKNADFIARNLEDTASIKRILRSNKELDDKNAALLTSLHQATEALRQWQQYCEQLPVQKTNIREWRLWQLTNSVLALPHLAKP